MKSDSEDAFYKELLRTYIDSTNDAIFVLCDEMKFLLCNNAGEKCFAVQEKRLTNHNKRMSITDIFKDKKTIDLFNHHFPAILEGQPVRFESLVQLNTVPEQWMEFTCNRVRLNHANMVIIIARDITERIKTELSIKEYNSNLENLIKERTKDLLIANNQKDKLFSIIAHDLRAPFNPIIGYSETMIEEDNLSIHDYQDLARKIYSCSKKTLRFLDTLLNWSRFQLCESAICKQPYNIVEIVNSAIDTLYESANIKNITINNNIEPVQIYLDKNILTIVLRNIISNAIKFTSHGGFITLSTFVEKDDHVISISDTGVGMSQETIDRIFKEKSTLSNKGTDGEEGTGLGLLFCIDLMNKHEGKINAFSVKGCGTTFCLKIPKRDIKKSNHVHGYTTLN